MYVLTYLLPSHVRYFTETRRVLAYPCGKEFPHSPSTWTALEDPQLAKICDVDIWTFGAAPPQAKAMDLYQLGRERGN